MSAPRPCVTNPFHPLIAIGTHIEITYVYLISILRGRAGCEVIDNQRGM